MALQDTKVRVAVTGAVSVGETSVAAPTGTGSALGTNEVQSVTITGVPTGGTFTLTFGSQTTTAIAYNATGATVQTALEALSSIGTGNVTVSGAAGGPYTVTFVNVLGNTNVAQMTATASLTGGTTPGVTVATTTPGVTLFADLGYIGEDGVTQSVPGAGDVERIKAWQNGATVRTIRTPSDDLPTWSFVLLETKRETIELYYGTTVTSTATEGSYDIDVQDARPKKSFVIDVIDGAELERVYVPLGVVSEIGDKVYANGEPIGYEVTIEGERDSSKGYNARVWATALKS